MRTRLFAISVCLFAGLAAAAVPAEAQYGARRPGTSSRATGETYNVELSAASGTPRPTS